MGVGLKGIYNILKEYGVGVMRIRDKNNLPTETQANNAWFTSFREFKSEIVSEIYNGNKVRH